MVVHLSTVGKVKSAFKDNWAVVFISIRGSFKKLCYNVIFLESICTIVMYDMSLKRPFLRGFNDILHK